MSIFQQTIYNCAILGFFLVLFSFNLMHGQDLGCTIVSACNYDSFSTVDDGSCHWEDCAGNCSCESPDNPFSCDIYADCAGNCGGPDAIPINGDELVEDECGICNGLGPQVTCWDASIVCNQVECTSEPPYEFRYTQSDLQAYYEFTSITINGVEIDADDWVGAFRDTDGDGQGDICVGSRQWDTSECSNGRCDVPVMGYNNFDNDTDQYCQYGDIPSFKIYDSDEDDYYEAVASEDINPWINGMNFPIDGLNCDVPDLSIDGGTISTTYTISNIYPNPFNPITSIEYSLPRNTNIKLIVYNIHGRQIQTLIQGFHTAGYHNINWNASNHPSGVYFIKLESYQYIKTQKVVLIK